MPSIPKLSGYVDPFIGCEASDLPAPQGIAATWWCAKPAIGNTHPGACTPFGMVSACAYSGAYVSGYGRYAVSLDGGKPPPVFEKNHAYGIAHFQQSGTGRIGMYYNYLLTTPHSEFGKKYTLTNERAEPAYYAGTFEEIDVDFEVTCTDRTAVHRYKFPKGTSPKLTIDISSGGLRIDGMGDAPTQASFAFTDSRRCLGWTRISGIPFHFEIAITTPVEKVGTWENRDFSDARSQHFERESLAENPRPFGIWIEAPENETDIEIRISFSLQSIKRAQAALATLTKHSFTEIAAQSSQQWEDVLSKISIEGATEEQQTIFYTALYRSALKPMNFRDENPFTKLPGPFFFDLCTLWDHYKTHLPLIFTLWPDWAADFITFLTEVREREGAFPISYTMDNKPDRFTKQATGLCHLILADAHHRGISGDWKHILKLLEGSSKGGKFSIFSENGVVEPLSHTLDLASAHFSMAKLAQHLGDEKIYNDAIPHADKWRNAFDSATGLLKEDSTYYEGENWNYSFRFLHDMQARIDLAGGNRNFIHLLDLFFGFKEPDHGQRIHRFEGLNNEPDMEAPYAYIYAGRHDRTAHVVRRIMQFQFTTGRGGLPGNEDSGALSSWFVWNAFGIFPVAGQPVMLIGSPLFERSVMQIPAGEFIIVAENQAPENFFIESATFNGKPLNRAWLTIEEFQNGGELRLKMNDQPSQWAQDSRPPSWSK
jgi:predicted alpha-1,2-mannosidase